MAGKQARRASPCRARLVRMVVFRTIVSAVMLLGALYGGLATGQCIVSYRDREAERQAQGPVPACIHSLPQEQLAAARRHHHRREVLPECYRLPRPRLAQLDAKAQGSLASHLHGSGNAPTRPRQSRFAAIG
jgi:hypothetical protein